MNPYVGQILFNAIIISVVFVVLALRLHFHCIVQRRRRDRYNIAADAFAVIAYANAVVCGSIDIWLQTQHMRVERNPEIPASFLLSIPKENEVSMLRALFFYTFGHLATMWGVKAAFLCSYFSAVRLGGKLRLMLWLTVILNAATFVGFLLMELLWCRPISRYWTPNPFTICFPLDSRVRGALAFVLHITTDSAVIAAGLSVIHKLQLSRRERWGGLFIAGLGVAVMGCSLARLVYCQRFAHERAKLNLAGTMQNFQNAYRASAIEETVAVVAMCAPSCRAMLRGRRAARQGWSRPSAAGSGTGGSSSAKRAARSEDLEMLTTVMTEDEREDVVELPPRAWMPGGITTVEPKLGECQVQGNTLMVQKEGFR
ncbi:hypothetical protein EDC01DRAFT_669572 [Geopyxis carbonaria]|nr:hypothetical protein EDC01DRAFT_669572 [Geopyxis carbonaria]